MPSGICSEPCRRQRINLLFRYGVLGFAALSANLLHGVQKKPRNCGAKGDLLGLSGGVGADCIAGVQVVLKFGLLAWGHK